MKIAVWVLTKEYNMYDQFGEYFVGVFGRKPEAEQLMEYGVPENRTSHVLNGGGRLNFEEEWYLLEPIIIEV